MRIVDGHSHCGVIHVIAEPRRGVHFLAARPWNYARRGLGFVARKDLDGRTGSSLERARPAKFAEAVAIANGRILAVGSDAEIQRYAGAEYQGR